MCILGRHFIWLQLTAVTASFVMTIWLQLTAVTASSVMTIWLQLTAVTASFVMTIWLQLTAVTASFAMTICLQLTAVTASSVMTIWLQLTAVTASSVMTISVTQISLENCESNQQDKMQLYGLIYYSKSALHVSGDVFAHHQEHLTLFTVSGSVHPNCCRLVYWMR
jgi:hypothetical protein